jgi:membrane associated rhomboid family serine protease
MHCPRCSYPLTVIRHPHKPVEIDQCKRCGGMFLEPHQAVQRLGPLADPSIWKKDPSVTDLGKDELFCPHDKTQMHAYVLASERQGVQLDQCSTCQGVWFDDKEAHRLFEILKENRDKKRREDDTQEKEPETPSVWSYLFQIITNLPVEGYHPTKNRPVLLWFLILSVVAVFAWEMHLILNYPSSGIKAFLAAYACVPAEVTAGRQYIGLFTYMFLHAGYAHLLGNLYFLYVFGDNVEDALGKTRFVLLYVLAGIAGALLHTVFAVKSTTPLVGASGAIAGVLAAYMILFPRVDIWVVLFFYRFRVKAMYYIFFWLGFQFVSLYFVKNIGGGGTAWLAHIGGFVAGFLLSYIMLWTSPVVQEKTGREPSL